MVDEQNGWEKLSDNPLIEFKEGNSTVDGDEELASVEDPAEVAVYINSILSDEAKMKQYNFKDHGDVNGIHLYTFMTDEYIFICHYTYADEHQAHLVRHQNMS